MNTLGIRQSTEDWRMPFMWRGWEHFHAWKDGRLPKPYVMSDFERGVIREIVAAIACSPVPFVDVTYKRYELPKEYVVQSLTNAFNGVVLTT